MAKLGIRDKDYRPNQYVHPMMISQKKEPAMGYGPYKLFDKNHPEHPDYKADEDDDDDIQLSLPLDYVKNQRNLDMMIANFLTGKTGEGKTLSDEAYDAGYDTIMETTEPDSYTRAERLKILNHQYFDQI